MKYPSRFIAAAVLTMVFSGPAIAHDDGRYNVYANGGWSGSATIYATSQGITGWTGTVGYGAAYPVIPVYAPQVVLVGPPHAHGPSCGHPHPYVKAYRKGHRHSHDRGRGWDHGHGRGKHH